MYEIEIKILEIDRKNIEEKLISLGAIKVFDDEIYAIYYDSSDNSIRKSKGTFRLRKEGQKSVLTFKSYVENIEAKVRVEKEVEVSDFDEMKAIIESIGFKAWIDIRKHRTTYEYKGVYFDFDRHLDKLGYIPEFLEIESADVETVYKSAELLGFSKQDCRNWDVIQVADYYSRHL